MFKSYETQLNAYAYIGQRKSLAPVTQLVLAYMEPVTDEQTARTPEVVDHAGFSMSLAATIVPVDVGPDNLPPRCCGKLARSEIWSALRTDRTVARTARLWTRWSGRWGEPTAGVR